jgi:hypothetical protein
MWEFQLRILLTNHGLRKRAGTELATFELAHALKGLGHEVGVFSPFLGRFAYSQAFKNRIPLFSLGDGAELEKFSPDVVHLQHWPNHLLLNEMGIKAPRLFHFHGALAPLESPPHITGICPPWLAVSEITFQSVAEDSSWDRNVGSRIGKWGSLEPQDGMRGNLVLAEGKLANVLVVSNHFPPLYSDWVRRAGQELGFGTTFIGSGSKVKPVSDKLILKHDAVISLGRTAVQSATLGKPTLLLDHLGLDGWITPLTYKDLESTGFSGSHLKDTDFTYEKLLEVLRSLPTSQELAEVAGIFRKNHSLPVIAKQIATHLDLASKQLQSFSFERSSFVSAMYIRDLHLTEERDNRFRFGIHRLLKKILIRDFHRSSTPAS